MNTKQTFEQLYSENQELKRAVAELSVLNEISSAINSAMHLEDIISMMIREIVRHIGVAQAAVLLLDDCLKQNDFQTMIREGDSGNGDFSFRMDDHLQEWMLRYRQPLLVNDLSRDLRFNTGDRRHDTPHSLLSVPMVVKGELIGIINAYNKRDCSGFSEADQRLLSIIASQSGQIIENARLREQEKTLALMQEEMQTAADIQQRLLPRQIPQAPGFDFAGNSIPASEVGGDYFDFICHKNHPKQIAVCVGDVTGKGLPASLLMANVQATVRSQFYNITSPGECIRNANTLLYESTGSDRFVTLFYGVVDVEKSTLSFCNGGHDNPYLVSGRGLRRLSTGGPVLGFVPFCRYEEETVALNPGERVVITSDGISEAMNQNEEEFGEKRLEAVIMDNPGLSSQELIGAILAAVREHTGNTAQSDDMTLAVITRAAEVEKSAGTPTYPFQP